MEERVDKVGHEKSVCCGLPVVTGVHRFWCKYHPRNQQCLNCWLLEGYEDLHKAYEAKITGLREENFKLTEARDKLEAFILNLVQWEEEEEEDHGRE